MKFVIRDKLNIFKKIISRNKLLIFLFLFSTLFFILQHHFHFSWDFKAYLINAEFLFSGGNYFEVYRAPLISIFLGFFFIFGELGRYIYILFASILFLISTIKLSDALYKKYFSKYKIKKETNRFLFYFFMLNPFLLYYGLSEGTELLGLAFFQFFLAYFIYNNYSGHFLGLAFLSRYNFAIFFPLLLINRDYKKILKNIGLFLLIVFPWLLFNYVQWENFLTSIIDSYYLNVLSRIDIAEQFNFLDIFKVIGWFLPFFIIGFFSSLKKFLKNKFSEYKYEFLFILILGIFIYDVCSIPFKVTRYMFNMVLPIAFFSNLGAIIFIKRYKKLEKTLYFIFIIIFIISIIWLSFSFYQERHEENVFYNASEKIKSLGLENCEILSSHWVEVNYYSKNVFYLYLDLDSVINQNRIALIFKDYETFDDTFEPKEIDDYPSIFESEEFILIANENITKETCIQKENSLKQTPIVRNPCGIIAKKFKIETLSNLVNKTCLLANKR